MEPTGSTTLDPAARLRQKLTIVADWMVRQWQDHQPTNWASVVRAAESQFWISDDQDLTSFVELLSTDGPPTSPRDLVARASKAVHTMVTPPSPTAGEGPAPTREADDPFYFSHDEVVAERALRVRKIWFDPDTQESESAQTYPSTATLGTDAHRLFVVTSFETAAHPSTVWLRPLAPEGHGPEEVVAAEGAAVHSVPVLFRRRIRLPGGKRPIILCAPLEFRYTTQRYVTRRTRQHVAVNDTVLEMMRSFTVELAKGGSVLAANVVSSATLRLRVDMQAFGAGSCFAEVGWQLEATLVGQSVADVRSGSFTIGGGEVLGLSGATRLCFEF